MLSKPINKIFLLKIVWNIILHSSILRTFNVNAIILLFILPCVNPLHCVKN